MKIKAYATEEAKQPLQATKYKAKSLEPFEVEVKITHCGVCHSDVHLINNDWGTSSYPLIPGHEIIGIISKVGKNVQHLHPNQRVGIGWQCSSCLECEWCQQGEENLCISQKATCVDQAGGFATHIRTDGHFVFPIPESLSSATTAPLFCGGATVYSPLRRFIHSPTQKVGVIGIGGLGHLALQFAKAFGCEVTAFSTSPDKKQDAIAFGADNFIDATNDSDLKQAANSLDFILSTVAKPLDWEAYLNILRPKGKLCLVGVVANDIAVPAFSLIGGRKSICASNIASRPTIKEMLEFAAFHKIEACIEQFPMQEVNTAISKLQENAVRYRAVLCNEIS